MALDSTAAVPSLDDAIDRQPLMVPPETPLVETVTLISQSHSRTCGLVAGVDEPLAEPLRSSCVLVVQGDAIVGILTERDVVRLAAKNADLQRLKVADVMIHPVVTLPQSSLKDIFAALFLFRRYRIRHLPVVDAADKLLGVISHESIRRILRPANLLRFRRVADVMTRSVIHAPLDTPVLQLARMMAEHRVSCVVITQLNEAENEAPVGIVTERDIVQFQAFQVNLANTRAEAVMSTPLFLLNPEDSLWVAHQAMQQRRLGRLVVSWNWGQGLGLVTQTSLLKVFDPMEMYGVIENLQETIQALQSQKSEVPEDMASSTSLDLAQVAYGRFAQEQQVEDTLTESIDIPLTVVEEIQQLLRQSLTEDASQQQRQVKVEAAIDLLGKLQQML